MQINSYRINWTIRMKEGTELRIVTGYLWIPYEFQTVFFYTPDFFGSEICFGADSQKVLLRDPQLWKPIPTNKKGTFTGVIILPTQTMHSSGEIPQIYHTCALFDAPQIGNLMVPVSSVNFNHPDSTSRTQQTPEDERLEPEKLNPWKFSEHHLNPTSIIFRFKPLIFLGCTLWNLKIHPNWRLETHLKLIWTIHIHASWICWGGWTKNSPTGG